MKAKAKNLDLTLVRLCQEKSKMKKDREARREELKLRNAKAIEYSRRKFREKVDKIIYGILTLAILVGITVKLASPMETDCEVIKTTQNKVFVEYEDDVYSFYGDGNGFEVGEEITCKFSNKMELIGVVE